MFGVGETHVLIMYLRDSQCVRAGGMEKKTKNLDDHKHTHTNVAKA